VKRFVTWRLIFRLQAGSLAGLLLCRLIDVIIFRNGNHLDHTSAGLTILGCLAIVFGGTTIIFVPLRIFWDRPQVQDVQREVAEGKINLERMSSFRRFFFDTSYASLPKWFYMPFVILAAILAGIAALGLIAFIFMAIAWLVFHIYSGIKNG
jgi:hypothetical protein